MKVAIISDIHGNMQALDAVLDDIKKENCDKIYCLGDLAMAGPEPVKTIEKIKSLIDLGEVISIQGNTDEMISDCSGLMISKTKQAFPLMGEALEDDCKLISTSQKEFLASLPAQLSLDINGVKTLLVHGSPRKNNENIFPDLPIKEVEEMVDSADADLIFCGHTHEPCGYQTNSKKTVVNVGSVGRPFTQNPQSCYVIATFGNASFDLKHKLISYDNQMAAELLSKRTFKGAEKLAQILIKPESRHM